MKYKTINALLSIIFALITVGAFYWLWTTSNNFTVQTTVADNLKPIEIESVKKDAENLISDLKKVSDIPLSVPKDKMGRENPFKSAE